MVAPWIKRRRARLIKAQEEASKTVAPAPAPAVTKEAVSKAEDSTPAKPVSAAAKVAAKRKAAPRKTRKTAKEE